MEFREGKLIKECWVVLPKLFEEGTVKLCNGAQTDTDTSIPCWKGQSNQRRQPKTVSPITIYSKVDNGVITEVHCKRYRKRKHKTEGCGENKESDEVVQDVVNFLLRRAEIKAANVDSINYSTPGIRELKLVRDFCEENGYSSDDYYDLKELFTFKTLPLVEPVAPKVRKESPAERKIKIRKVQWEESDATHDVTPIATVQNNNAFNQEMNNSLKKIENEKIRKILENFEKLSKHSKEENPPKQVNIDNSTKCNRPILTVPNFTKKTSAIVKPLNLSTKDNPINNTEKHNTDVAKVDQATQSDISVSGSILKHLLHKNDSIPNNKINESHQQNTKQLLLKKGVQKINQVAKKSIGQQTDDLQRTITHQQQPRINQNGVKFTRKRPELIQSKSETTNYKWINDPKAILKKIHKLKRDILYLDLLAEEKEKERIAILCFKNYKESILKKIFSNEISEGLLVQNHSNGVNSAFTPKHINNPPSVPTRNDKALYRYQPLKKPLYPSTGLRKEATHPIGLPNEQDCNYQDPKNCIKCGFTKNGYLCSGFCKEQCCNVVCQARQWNQHSNFYRVASSTSTRKDK